MAVAAAAIFAVLLAWQHLQPVRAQYFKQPTRTRLFPRLATLQHRMRQARYSFAQRAAANVGDENMSRCPPLMQRAAAAAADGSDLILDHDAEDVPRSPLHHLSPFLQNRGKAEVPRKIRLPMHHRRPQETQVVRIALTGGPCAGKSSALEHIITAAKKEGYDVYTAPETATLTFNSGVTIASLNEVPDGPFILQECLARTQLQIERSLTKLAGVTGRPSIVIFDRGIMDQKGYMDETLWKRLLSNIGGGGDGHENGVDEQYILERYDAVIHMVTAADGAGDFYKWGKTIDDSGNAVYRSEPPEIAKELDRKMQQVWARHPNHIIIKNVDGKGFKEKLEATAAAVVAVARAKETQLRPESLPVLPLFA